jgi:hypothetical protein
MTGAAVKISPNPKAAKANDLCDMANSPIV